MGNGSLYFFRNQNYIRFTGTGVDAGYPRAIVPSWTGLDFVGQPVLDDSKEISVGSMDGPPQTKIEKELQTIAVVAGRKIKTHVPVLFKRRLQLELFVTIPTAEEIAEAIIEELKAAVVRAAVASALSSALLSPAAAWPAFVTSFSNELAAIALPEVIKTAILKHMSFRVE